MNPFVRFWAALGNLAAAIEGLTSTVHAGNDVARAKLGLPPEGKAEPPALANGTRKALPRK